MNRLHELRLEKKLKMTEVAKQIGIPYTTYVGYEKQEREPDSEMLIKLANYFSVSIDYLVGRTDIKKAAIHKDDGLDNDSIQLLEAFKSLSKEQQRMIIAQLQGLTQFQKDQDD